MSSKMVVSFASMMVVLAGCSSSGGSSSNNGQTGGGLGGIGLGNKDGGAPTTETSKPSTGGGGNTKDGGAKEEPAAGTCTLEHVTLSDNECGKCQGSKCCTQWTACDGDIDCLQLMGCVDQCQGDEACLNTCAEQFPNDASQKAALGVLQCVSGSCSASCN